MERRNFAGVLFQALLASCVITASSTTWAAIDTWTGAGANANWNTGGNWSATGNAPPVANDVLVFDGSTQPANNNNFTANTQFNGLTFNSTAGAFVLGGNAIALGGDINDNSTALEKLTLGLVLNGGTENVNVVSGGSLALGALTFGNALGSTTVSTLNVNASTSLTALTAQTNNSSANVLSISGSNVLTLNGAMIVGFATSITSPTPATVFNVTGNELDVNGNVTVGQAESGASTRTNNTLDMSGLATFKMVSTGSGGNFSLASVSQANGTVLLANAGGATSSNLINTLTISISSTTSNAGAGLLSLGGGTNTLEANQFNVGTGKGNGTIQFIGSGGSVTISGANGTGTANIDIGKDTSATSSSSISGLAFAGHNATVAAGNITLGTQAGNTGGIGIGNITFDTGTFNVANLLMAINSSGADVNGSRGAFYLGGTSYNPNATGVLNVTGSLVLGNNTNTAAASATAGALVVNGGTANIGSDITVAGTQGTRNSYVVLAGGTLNMQGHQIGTAAAPVTNIGLTLPNQVATLSNLGGGGINGAGLSLTSSSFGLTNTLTTPTTVTNLASVNYGGGTLILAGTNTYSGGTTVNSGALLVNGTLAISGSDTVSVNGGLLGGTGTINQAVTLGSGTLTGGTGATGPAGATGTLNLAGGLTVNGGTLSFNLGTTTSNSLNITGGAATFNSGSLALLLTGSPTSGQTYNLITASSPLTGGALAGFLTPVTIGRSTLTPSLTAGGDDLTVTVSGGPATLVWNNAGGSPADGQTWDVQTNQNWNSGLPGGSGGTGSHDLFFTNDNVIFNDNNNATSNGGTNPNAYTVTVAPGGVSPGAVTVNNSLGNYTIGGDVIFGTGTLSKSGSGALTLSGANTYSGGTTLTQGTLDINNGGSSTSSSIGTGKLTIAGGAINNTSGSPVVLQSNNAQSWASSFSYLGSNVDNTHDLNLGTGTVSLDGANVTLTLGGSASTLTVGGTIQNGASGTGFTVSGTGTLVLSGASTYTGNTAINSGVLLKVAGTNFTNQLGVGGAVNIAAGGTLDIGGITTANSVGGFGAKQFNIAGNGVGGIGALYNSGTQQQNAFQKITLTADASVGGSNTGGTAGRLDMRGGTPVLDLAGHTLTKNGANVFALVGATVNSTGGTPGAIVVNSGELGLETNTAVGPTAVSSITLNGNSFLELFNDTAATSTITAPVVVAGSGVIIGPGNNVANNIGSPITLQNNVTFEPLTNNAVNATANDQMIVSGNITDGNGGFSITKIGGATDVTTLSGTNSWTGGTNIKSGILKLGSNTALPTAGTVVNFGATGTNGTLDLGGFNGNVGGLVDANAGGTGNIIGNSSTTSNSTLNYVAGTSNFDGMIQDTVGAGTKTVALSVTGGFLTLNASNNYSGGTTVGGTGTLQIGSGQSSALGATSGSLTVNTGGTLDLNGNNVTVGALSGTGGSITNTTSNTVQLAVGTAANSTFGGAIGNGTAGGITSLLKQNNGTLTLSSVNTYTGDTTINQGTLNVTGKLAATGNVNVSSTLSGDGNGTTTGVVGKVNLSGGTVNPGTTAGAIGTLGMASLQGGGTLHFDIGASGNNDKLVVSGTADISSSNIVPVPTNSPFYFTPGSYTLLTSSSLTGTGNFQPPMARQMVSLNFSTPNTVKLNVADAGQSATLTWNNNPGGGDGQTWDVANNRNWTSSATILDPDKFYNGDNVIFNDSNNFPTNSNAYNVNINGNVNPGSVTVNTASTYTIGGGGIIGTGSLTKSGTGTLVLNTSSSTYSGGTFVLNGTLKAGSFGAFSPNSAITLGDGSANTSGVLDLNGTTISVGGLTTAGTGTGNIVGNSSTTSSASLNFTGGTSSFGGIIQDSINGGTQTTSLTVATGTLKLAGNSTYTGGTTINPGATLQLGDTTTTGSVPGTINDNGALAYGHTNSVSVADGIINGGGQLIQNGSGTVTLGHETGFSGQTVLNAGTLALIADDSINNATGGIVFNGGALQFNNYASALPATSFNNAGPVKLGASGSPDASSSGVAANIIANGGSALSTATVIAGTSSLTFVGPGTLELLATNTYTGNTTISGGTLVASTSASLGSLSIGAVNITSGGTLDLSGDATANNLNFAAKQFNIAGNGSDGQGAIVNNGTATQQNAFGKITLTADASVGGSSAGGNAGRFDMRSSTPVLDLAGHKLTKLGGNQFTLVGTQVNSSGGVPGSIEVAAGELGLETTTAVAPAAVSSITLDANTRLEFFQTTTAVSSPIIVAGTGVLIGSGQTTAATVASPVTLQNDVTFEPINTNAANPAGTTQVTLTGNITESGGSHGIIKLGVNTLTLNGVNTYSGVTTVNQGTLQLGVANSTPNTSQLVLGGGTLTTSGLNQTMTSANLLLNGASTIDFGTGASILKFADSSAQTWTGTLTINNWSGTTVTGGGIDQLFVGATGTGLTSTQLADINFTGFGTGASILSDGEVVPFFAGGPLKGDINQDGHVDVQDIQALMKALTDIGSAGTSDTSSYAFQHPTLSNTQIASILDVNGDGSDNNADIQGLINYLLAGNGSTSPVPEPTSLVLLSAGGALLLAKRARRKSMQVRSK